MENKQLRAAQSPCTCIDECNATVLEIQHMCPRAYICKPKQAMYARAINIILMKGIHNHGRIDIVICIGALQNLEYTECMQYIHSVDGPA